MKTITTKELKLVLKGFLPNAQIVLEDRESQFLPREFFEPSGFRKFVGLPLWPYKLDCSDCGKFAIRYWAELLVKFEKKHCNSAPFVPSAIIGLIGYYRDNGNGHNALATVLDTPNGYEFACFERHKSGFQWNKLSDKEMKSVEYFYAF